jgi:A/G-specific adenine glycosylase
LVDFKTGSDLLVANQKAFVEQLLAWWETSYKDLPWRRSKDPYAIWVSEVMLQQTQIVTAIPYYDRWMSRFPTIKDLARASLEEVLRLWQGLGYYSRARNLHSAAKIVLEQYDGQVPEEVSDLMALPGIGRYTAGAIASIAFGRSEPVLDGNVIRVISRLIDLEEDVTSSKTRNKLWLLTSNLVPTEKPGDYNQALMELGQQICLSSTPKCNRCPVSGFCLAREKGTQYERPVRPPRKRIPHFDVVAGIIWRSEVSRTGKFLIARRPLNGMLGGLWEFPGGKVEVSENNETALQREVMEELGIDIQVDRHLCDVKHGYTHFRITLHAFHAFYISGTVQNIGVADHAWVSLSDLDHYAFAVTDLRIIEKLRREFA